MSDTNSPKPASDSKAPQPETRSPKQGDDASSISTKKMKRKGLWWKIPMRIIGCILLVIILVPVLIYVPPIQTAVKNLACDIVEKSTGMKIEIGHFSLRFPLDIQLDDLRVIPAPGDTMVAARQAIADIQLLPLLHLDARINRLNLSDAKMRILSADSSMDMRILAGSLIVGEGSAANIKTSHISLRDAKISDGHVSMVMNVWKKQASADTTSVPFIIDANNLRLENFSFAMSMLPTIDTLRLAAPSLDLRDAVINLKDSKIHAASLSSAGGDFTYLTPTAEYIAAHPVPVDSVSPASPPMIIEADSIDLSAYRLLYAIKGASPLPGFDASYISLSDLDISLSNFYNAATTIKAPVTSLSGRERSGLQVTSGSGVFSMDSTGMALSDLKVATPFSRIGISALIPNSLLAFEPSATVEIDADASIGMQDAVAFMPTLGEYARAIGLSNPLNARIIAHGTLDNVDIPRLDLAIPATLSLRASGKARNILDLKRLQGEVAIDGELTRPGLVNELAGPLDFDLPRLALKGKASADRQTYALDMKATTTAGDLAAVGKVSLTAESYQANVQVKEIDLQSFVKDLPISFLTADIQAKGAGFNPERPSAHTDVKIQVSDIVYDGHPLRNITADLSLLRGDIDFALHSPNRNLNLDISGKGNIKSDLYRFDIDADIRYADLMAMGFSPTQNSGSGQFTISGTASPKKWNYDVALDLSSLDWTVGEATYDLPPLQATFRSTDNLTAARVESDRLGLTFDSPRGLKNLLDELTAATAGLDKQIAARNLDMASIEDKLPPFMLKANGNGNGILRKLLSPSGIAVDTLYLTLGKDSVISGNMGVRNLVSGTMVLDTITLDLRQREHLIDYALHLGNGPGAMDEFANVNLAGYIANNRLSAYLTQQNLKGEQGYRLGFTGALNDSILSLHFTPLKATIAYLPWTINLDNHLDYRFSDHRIDANLKASSESSSILIKTEPLADGDGEQLHLNLTDIHLQDFLKMSVQAPPLTATVNSDILLSYDGKSLQGNGSLDLTDLSYARQKIQDIDLNLLASLDPKGDSKIAAILNVARHHAMTGTCLLVRDSVAGLQPTDLKLNFDGLPLALANPFLGPDMVSLSGELKGECDVAFDKGIKLNGALRLDSAGVFIPMMDTRLKLDSDPIPVDDNVITFDQYTITGVNSNPLTLNGSVDASNFSDIRFDLLAAASNFQLVGTSARSRADLRGKLFLNLDARARGSMSLMDINATMSILSATDVTYTLSEATQLEASSKEGLVKFVNLADSTLVAKADSLTNPTTAMRISASLTLQPGVEATVNIPAVSGTSGKVVVSPSGTLSYFQNYMGDMKLNGQLLTGEGSVRYALPVIGTKTFQFEPESSITWNGDLMNPTLNISANDPVKANVSMNGQASLVDFNVILNITGNLAQPNLIFDLSTDNDMTIQNELQGMTADQRSTTAMNLLLTGQYTGSGAKNVNSNFLTGNIYNILTSQINSWAANAIKGVDLSFGVDQYETGDVNNSSTTTSYSYQMSKSLFDNRFKIIVGGNYSTDANADENFAQNLISDISFEYILMQRTNSTLLARLFRHTGYESILEGEITETGLGFAYRRKLNNLRSLFRLPGRRRKQRNDSVPAGDATRTLSDTLARPAAEEGDSVVVLKKHHPSSK